MMLNVELKLARRQNLNANDLDAESVQKGTPACHQQEITRQVLPNMYLVSEEIDIAKISVWPGAQEVPVASKIAFGRMHG